MRKRIFGLSFFIFLLFIFPLSAISIGKLKSDPKRYNGDIVRLRGEVSFKAGIPFTDLLVYILEDKTGSILVFSAYPKEREEIISIKAEVIAYSGDENETQRESTVDRMSEYLIDKEILDREHAGKVSEISLRFINSLADAATGTWFLIEQEKSGLFNL